MKTFYSAVISFLLLTAPLSVVPVRAEQPNAPSASLLHYLVPIANVQSSVWNERAVRKGLTLQGLRRLYFVEEVSETEEAVASFTDYVEPTEERPVDYVVYSATGAKATGTRLFAALVGLDAAYLRGQRVLGSERQVLNVVRSQPQAVSFADVNDVFTGESGAVAEGIRVLPFDINGDGRVTDAERQAVTSRTAFEAYVAGCSALLLAEK